MKELLISQVAPVAATAVVAILVALIKAIGGATIEVLAKKKEEIEQKIKATGHEEELKTAKEVWDIIEEKYRITENAAQVLESKSDEFDKLLLQRIPGLSQENIDDLRQAIAGQVNAGKQVILTKEDAIKQLQESNTTLQTENSSLKEQLNKVQALVGETQTGSN
ncbi:hypothetical protein [Clostridium sp. BL-8]|uniref:hypothetical protein n=1 Tax=Clostridium sp. BL-8 TaxID=349938 RepID=UPI00098CEBA0|nr:hypothetical protein [Clostridium sp. BL-8]OOM69661.1 hypothetical protein CLOBL_51820 [Clostridium sp. BL-8]